MASRQLLGYHILLQLGLHDLDFEHVAQAKVGAHDLVDQAIVVAGCALDQVSFVTLLLHQVDQVVEVAVFRVHRRPLVLGEKIFACLQELLKNLADYAVLMEFI